MSSNNTHENLTERAFCIPEKKKSHETSSQKSKAEKEKRLIERRRAIKNTQLVNDMHELQEEIRKRRKRPSIFSKIRKFFA